MAPSRAVSLLLSILSILVLSISSFAAVPDRITATINASQTVALDRSHHPKAQPRYDRGPADPSVNFNYLTLKTSPSPAQQKALSLLLAQQQDPRSPNYHKWLTPAQFAQRFGLSQNDLTKIANWLTAQGFQILSVGGGHNTIIFSGTAGQAQQAFGTEIHSYYVDGQEHIANSSAINVPAALKGIVTGVIGLNDFRPVPASHNRQLRAMRPQYYDGNFVFTNFLAPGDINTIYNIPSTIDGTGQKLAVVGITDIYLDDLNDFRTGFGFNTKYGTISCTTSGGIVTACNDTHFKYVLNGPDPGVSDGDLFETDLDLEWSGATAPGAQIIYVNSGATSGSIYDALDVAINPPSGPPLAPVISMSYGYFEQGAPDLEDLLQQGNAEGVTVMNSSGDVGSTASDYDPVENEQPFATGAVGGLAVSYPASSQYVTGVGGTEITLANDGYPSPSSFWSTTIGNYGGTAQTYIPEIPWNDDEEFANYCHAPAQGDTFCSTGGGTPGWLALGTSATAQQVQEDIWIAQGGGGASNCWYLDPQTGICLGTGAGPSGGGFAQPLYQQGLSVSGAPAGVRWVPDVSLMASADFPGYIFCTPQFEFQGGSSASSSCANGIFDAVDTWESLVGGTSAAAPVFSGMVTLLNQYVVQQGIQLTPGLGNINAQLYFLAGHNSTNQVFHQYTTGDNMVYCDPGQPSGYPSNIVCPAAQQGKTQGVFGFLASNADTTTGYNLVNGLGSVNVGNLFTAWAGTGLATTTTSLQSSENPSNIGDSVTFTATVTTSGTSTPTGSVTFKNGTSTIGTGTLGCVCDAVVNSATTSISTSTLPAGTLSITAVYAGDSNNAGSTSSALSQVVNEQDFQFSGTVTDPPQAQPGQTTTTSMTLQAVGSATFLDTVTYSCSGLPTGATCTFNPISGSIVSGTTSPQTVAITVNTAGPFVGAAGGVVHNGRRRAENQKLQLWLPLTLPLAGIFFVGFAGRGLRRRHQVAGLCVMLVFAGFLVACGGGGSSAAPVAVSVSPNPLNTLWPNLQGAPLQAQQFTATVTGTSNTAVTWAISSGGTTDTIASDGIYTAPTATPPTAVVVTATSQADPSKTGSATVNIKTPTPSGNSTITVTVTEGSGGAAKQHTTSFTLSVQ